MSFDKQYYPDFDSNNELDLPETYNLLLEKFSELQVINSKYRKKLKRLNMINMS